MLRVSTLDKVPEPAAVPPLPLEPLPKIIRAQPHRQLFPHWVISFVVLGVVSLAVASSIHRFISPAADVSANTAPRLNVHQPKAISAQASPVRKPTMETDSETEYPFARFVEVRGLRVVDLHDVPQVQYLVINHSSSQLSDIGLRIAVRSSATSGGSAPLFTLAARVPTLGPNESKEMRVDLDSTQRAAQLPDWPNLRTEVRVVTP